MNKRKIGETGENIAADYLLQIGFVILKRNYFCVYGEIDLIAENKNDIVFFEVKTRKNLLCGNPADAVNLKKQSKIKNSALDFIATENIYGRNFRFDVIEIILGKKIKINHIVNAFEV